MDLSGLITNIQLNSFLNKRKEREPYVVTNAQNLCKPNVNVNHTSYYEAQQNLRELTARSIMDFSCRSEFDELDFLIGNEDLIEPINSTFSMISKINSTLKYELELMRESEDWVVLFINIKGELSWEQFSLISDKFYESIIQKYPKQYSRLNLSYIEI